eukprot:5018174-Prymnesium_polylepis.1
MPWTKCKTSRPSGRSAQRCLAPLRRTILGFGCAPPTTSRAWRSPLPFWRRAACPGRASPTRSPTP